MVLKVKIKEILYPAVWKLFAAIVKNKKKITSI